VNTKSVTTGATNVNIKSHGYYSYRFQIRKNLDVTDIVVPGPTYVTIKSHEYYSHRFNIRKYLEVTDIVNIRDFKIFTCVGPVITISVTSKYLRMLNL
jgi:hypothetical protein